MTPKQKALKRWPCSWCEPGKWSDPEGPAFLILQAERACGFRRTKVVTRGSGPTRAQAWADAASKP